MILHGRVQQIRDLEGPGKGRDVQIAYGVRRGRRVCGASKPPPQTWVSSTSPSRSSAGPTD